jgi:STE24 endopeptidase
MQRLKLPAAVLVAVLVAEAGVWLLRPPREIEPVAAPETRYFSPAQLERARDYAGGQRLLAILGLAAQGAVLVLLVARPPRRAVSFVQGSSGARVALACAAAGGLIVIATSVVGLPTAAVAHQRAVDFGLSTQSWAGWSWDEARSLAIGAVFGAAGGALFSALIRRFRRRWWLAASGVVVLISAGFVWLAPIVLDPIFNRYTELPPGRTRSDVLALARKADISVGDVLVVDASRRTRTANAYVTGLGHTKRVVLYDTLLERFTPAQTRLVVAHELGHVKHRDVLRGLGWTAIATPAAMYVVMLLTERWSRRAAAPPGSPTALPAFALALAVAVFAGTVIGNQLSRPVEAAADAFSLELTDEPRGFVELERELALANLSDPDPPALLHWLFGTHPTTMERIGAALAFERERHSAAR